MKISCLGGYRRLIHKVGSGHPQFELSRLKSHQNFLPLPCFATISLVPDSEGHKPKQNDIHSYGDK